MAKKQQQGHRNGRSRDAVADAAMLGLAEMAEPARSGPGFGLKGGIEGLGAEACRRDQRYVRQVRPKSAGQAALLAAIDSHSLTLALGPAGTGKTYLAVVRAVEALESGRVERLVLTRPAVEAGERLGWLPGDVEAKMDPYLRPLYDALTERMGIKRLRHAMGDGTVEIAPIAFMRGRTLNNAFVVIDEAQNCTYAQLKMLVTRLGWHATMVLTGDPAQSDLLEGMSGLDTLAMRIARVPDVAVIRLSDSDVVRHPLVAALLPNL